MTTYNTKKLYCKTCKTVTYHKEPSFSEIMKILGDLQNIPWCSCSICGEEKQECTDILGKYKLTEYINECPVYCKSCKAFTDNAEPAGSVMWVVKTYVHRYFWCTCASCKAEKRRDTDKIGCDDEVE